MGACRIFPISRELWDKVTTLSRKGYIVSWANECDGALDNVSVVSGSNCQLGDSNGGLVNWEKIKEPLVVQPLAMANLVTPLVEVANAFHSIYHHGLRNESKLLGNLWVLPWKASKWKLMGFF